MKLNQSFDGAEWWIEWNWIVHEARWSQAVRNGNSINWIGMKLLRGEGWAPSHNQLIPQSKGRQSIHQFNFIKLIPFIGFFSLFHLLVGWRPLVAHESIDVVWLRSLPFRGAPWPEAHNRAAQRKAAQHQFHHSQRAPSSFTNSICSAYGPGRKGRQLSFF